MLIRILRDYLRPYYGQLVIVVLLQLVANAAALYLPTLNARIVDDGIAKGNTGLILSLGVLMLVVTVVQMAALPSDPLATAEKAAARSAAAKKAAATRAANAAKKKAGS